MEAYRHAVQYYETDRMGIAHHSNYVRWMEEARIDFLRQIGYPYETLEAEGMISPVTAVECRYRKSTTFGDTVEIRVAVSECRGVILKLRYAMTNQDGQLVFEGRSEHCFLDADGRILRLNRAHPAFFEKLASLVQEQ